MSRALSIRILAILGLALLLACDALAAVGTVQFTNGDVRIRDAAGSVRAARKGDAIDEGDTILTGSLASVQLKMSDGGILAIRPDSELTLDVYRFSGKEDGTQNALMSLLKGGFRTITGIIGRTNRNNYKVNTPTANIGIRGTDHEPFVILAALAGAPQPPAPPGTYDKVNVGEAYISSPLGTINVSQNQVGFAAQNLAPTIVPVMPEFFRATPAIQASAPATGTTGSTAESTSTTSTTSTTTTTTTTQVRETAVVDSSPSVTAPTTATSTSAITTTTTTTIAATTSSAVGTVQQPVTGTASGTDLNLNLTDQTVSTSSGSTAPVEQGAFPIQAQTAANDALLAANSAAASVTSIQPIQTSANSTLSTINSLTVSTSPTASAISTASGTISTAQTAVTNVNTLAAVDTGLAASNASTASGLASTSASRAALAQANVAGGFADAGYAVPANTVTQGANTGVQSANASVQTAAGDVTTQNTLFTTAKTDANSALNTANAQLASASALLGTANTNVTALGTAQSTSNSLSSAINMALGSAQTASSLAQQAAANTQSAATLALTLQNAGDFTGAQAALTTAQAELANAQIYAAQAAAQLSPAQTAASGLPAQLTAAQTAYSAANAAVTGSVSAATSAQSSAGIATTNATTATAAQTAAVTAVGTTSTQLANEQIAANTVAANYLQAQYSNPAVASSNFAHNVDGLKLVAGGTERTSISEATPVTLPNTTYVLNENKDLIEIRHTTYERFGLNYTAQPQIADANLKLSGGTAQDHYNAADGTVYIGRRQSGQIDVTDNSSVVPPFTQQLGLTSAHWIVGLVPSPSGTLSNTFGPVNNVQQVVGTANYTLTAATHPTDSFGNVGTLTSGSLSANFNSQTVNASLNLTFNPARDLSIAATATNAPITGYGFEAQPGSSNAPVVNCSGATCAPTGYAGGIGGAFISSASGGITTGAVGSSAAVGYGFAPINPLPGVNQPFDDFISGAAVFGAASAPAVGVTNTFPNNANVRHEAIYPVSDISSNTFATVVRNSINLTVPTPQALNGPTTNTNYLFDSAGNLVRIFDTPYVVFDHGTNVAPTTTQFPVATPLAHAQVSFGGDGATPAENFYDPNTQIRLGRWQSGFVSVLDLATGTSYTDPLGLRSIAWLVAPGVTSLPISGQYHYTRILDGSGNFSFANAPTDSYGNVGVLEGARLGANFTSMKVSAGLRLSIASGPGGSLGNQILSAGFTDTPIQNGGFNVSSDPAQNPPNTDNLHVSCADAGCAPNQTYGGRVRGGFSSSTAAPNTADGAYYRYTFVTNYPDATTAAANGGRVFNDYVDGMVAFKQGPQLVPPPTSAATGPSEVLTSHSYQILAVGPGCATPPCTFTQTQNYRVNDPSNYVSDGSGNLLSVADDQPDQDQPKSLSVSGGTPVPSIPVTTANGVTVGWYSNIPALSLSGQDFNGTFSGRQPLDDGLAWVRGPGVYPWYLPGAISTLSNSGGTAISGVANYTLDAAVARDQNGVGPTGPITAALKADFNRSAVGFDMTVPMTGGTWAGYNNGTTHNGTIIANIRMEDNGGFFANTNGDTPDTHQQMTVTYTGSPVNFGNLQGQLMGSGLNGAGMVFNYGASNGDRVNGALAFSNASPYSVFTPYRLIAAAFGMNSLGTTEERQNFDIQGGAFNQFQFDNNGFPIRWNSQLPVLSTSNGCGGCPANLNDLPVIYAVTGATGAASVGNAPLVQSGRDAATGLFWGRYGGTGAPGTQTIGVTDRITGASLGTIDVSQQGAHFIMTSGQAGPTVLPISGTANYTLVGNTNPTDNLGNVGALGSATLSANFTAKTVTTAVNLSIAGSTWNASASAMPIQNDVFFQARRALDGTGTLNVSTTRVGSDPRTAGQIAGVLTGQTGIGAALLYSLNQGGHSSVGGTTVSGVAAFKR
jgi:hypothetical protein